MAGRKMVGSAVATEDALKTWGRWVTEGLGEAWCARGDLVLWVGVVTAGQSRTKWPSISTLWSPVALGQPFLSWTHSFLLGRLPLFLQSTLPEMPSEQAHLHLVPSVYICFKLHFLQEVFPDFPGRRVFPPLNHGENLDCSSVPILTCIISMCLFSPIPHLSVTTLGM